MNINSSNFLILFIVLGFSCAEQRYSDPLSPEESLESFELVDGFKIEVFAAEPHVFDPVEMIFNEQGDAYVVEMPDYPFKPEPGKAEGRIRLLRDSDGDGRIDESKVFADKLMEATSILPWKGGLLVTTAPNILYLKDTNGDFQADTREVIFSGFFEDNSEAQITSLRFSVDNCLPDVQGILGHEPVSPIIYCVTKLSHPRFQFELSPIEPESKIRPTHG